MLQTAMPARRPGRPSLGPHPMPAFERKARSRATRKDTVQLNVEVPAEVRNALRKLADKTGQTQAAILQAAVTEYFRRHARD